ncbi:MAG: T9SS type A sorting domain-containing protein [Candidatus Coatesbacteria bacterium]|nr:T9SS type A sorting domain-containing protein [Candidatus Coatesbacteria bacterium]
MRVLLLILISVTIINAERIKVYFNAKVDTTGYSGNYAKGLSDFVSILKEKIDSTRYSIDICLYNLDLSEITDKIIEAYRRGVKIRVITDDEHKYDTEIQRLIYEGIPVIDDSFGGNPRSNIMHNKFWIFDFRDSTSMDDDFTMTGSWNVTYANTYKDANNIVFFQDNGISRAYTTEFEEMWGSGTEIPDSANSCFHNRKSDNTVHEFDIDGTKINLFFNPTDTTELKMVRQISECKKEADFCIYAFSSDTVSHYMKIQWDVVENFKVQGVFDRTFWDTDWSKARDMRGDSTAEEPWDPPAPVYSDSVRFPDQSSGLLHSKYMILDPFDDSAVVITGSSNWSLAGFYDNDENVVMIHDKKIAQQYYQDFIQRYKEAQGTGFNSKKNAIKKSNIEQYETLKIYPIPIKDFITFDFNLKKERKVDIILYDISGRYISLISSTILRKGNSKRTFKLPEGLKKGVYLIKISDFGYKKIEVLR